MRGGGLYLNNNIINENIRKFESIKFKQIFKIFIMNIQIPNIVQKKSLLHFTVSVHIIRFLRHSFKKSFSTERLLLVNYNSINYSIAKKKDEELQIYFSLLFLLERRYFFLLRHHPFTTVLIFIYILFTFLFQMLKEIY